MAPLYKKQGGNAINYPLILGKFLHNHRLKTPQQPVEWPFYRRCTEKLLFIALKRDVIANQ
jgi:hypothetical protein